MSHGTLAVSMEVLVELTKTEAGAKRGLPVGLVHGEAVEVLEVNHEATAVASEAKVAVVTMLVCRKRIAEVMQHTHRSGHQTWPGHEPRSWSRTEWQQKHPEHRLGEIPQWARLGHSGCRA